MGGIGLLLLCVFYLWLTFYSTNKLGGIYSRKVGVITFLVMLSLPFADAVVGRVVLDHLCESKGRLVVNEKAPEVEGLSVGPYVYADSAKYYGYMWVESIPDSWGWVQRSISNGPGKGRLLERARPQALYALNETRLEKSLFFNIRKYSVWTTYFPHTDPNSHREMSYFYWYSFRGGWAERVAMMFGGGGPSDVAQCGGDLSNKTIEMLNTTLEPLMFPKNLSIR